MKKLTFISVLFLALLSCSKDDQPVPPNNNGGNPNPNPVVSLEDTLSRRWYVDEATHNGSPDNSSKGLILNIKKDGTYILESTGYQGTWEFIENKTKVLLDKNNSSFKTTWTIQLLTSKNLNVTFKSPFTGGNAVWKLRPKL